MTDKYKAQPPSGTETFIPSNGLPGFPRSVVPIAASAGGPAGRCGGTLSIDGKLDMASEQVETVERHDAKERTGELADENLVEQFLRGDEIDSDDDFRSLVELHGPMVLGVCRFVLGQEADAEDAFQATFLALARKWASIRNRTALEAWLHNVAYRTAIKMSVRAVRRRTLERQSVSMLPSQIVPDRQHHDAAWNELRPVLHEEVSRLPDKYRVPIVLSYLEGKTNEEVAQLLHWPIGTVKGRLSRARALLHSRLMRRGVTLSAAFLLMPLADAASSPRLSRRNCSSERCSSSNDSRRRRPRLDRVCRHVKPRPILASQNNTEARSTRGGNLRNSPASSWSSWFPYYLSPR